MGELDEMRRRRVDLSYPLLSVRWMYVSHVFWAVAGSWGGYALLEPSSGLSLIWMTHSAMLVAIAMSMSCPPGTPAPRLRTVVAVNYVGFIVGGLLYGVPFGELLYVGLANLVAVACGIWCYRLRGIGGSWVPRDARETVWMMLSLATTCVVGAVLGAFPGSGLFSGTAAQQLIWAAARAFGGITVSAYCLLPLYLSNHDRLGEGLAPRTVAVAMAIPLWVACLAVPIVLPGVPLSWLYVVPPVWAALIMTRRGVAVYTLMFGLVGSFIPYAPYPRHVLGGLITPEAIVDATFAFVSFLAMLLIALRCETQRLQRHASGLADSNRSAKELFTSVIQSMADGMIVADRGGRVSMTNLAADTLATVGIPDQLDIAWVEAVDLQADAADRAARETLLRTMLQPAPGATRRLEVLLPRPDGARRLALSSTDLPAGPQRLTLLMFRDVTLARQRQEELESFAGTVAHDLKGPLTSLFGWMEAAGDELADHDPASGRAALERAHQAVDRMRSLIDDYLAHAVSHGGELRITDVDLARVVQDIVSVYARTIDGPVFDVDVPHVLRADASLTRQLMANLIGNGVKYAKEGERAHLQVVSRDDEPGWAEVRIADRGRGLQPGDEERIFGRLNRSDKDAGAVQGIGLGLALCHAIVTRHGGTISAANNEWGGATFRFTLPSTGESS